MFEAFLVFLHSDRRPFVPCAFIVKSRFSPEFFTFDTVAVFVRALASISNYLECPRAMFLS